MCLQVEFPRCEHNASKRENDENQGSLPSSKANRPRFIAYFLMPVMNDQCFVMKIQRFGRYSRALAEFAREKAAELRKKEQAKKEEKEKRSRELMHTYRGKWTRRMMRVISFVWQSTFAKIGEDWVFLALLGIIMALISYVMDYGAALCGSGKCTTLFTFLSGKSP